MSIELKEISIPFTVFGTEGEDTPGLPAKIRNLRHLPDFPVSFRKVLLLESCLRT